MDEKPADEGKKPLMRQCYVTANASMTYLGNGCAIGFPAILIPSLRTKESHIHATVNEESWIAASMGLAFIFGNIFVTAILDKLGRKKCHFLAIVLLLVGWFILLLANSVAGLIAARVLHGFAIGMYGFLGIVIIGEMTAPKNRGLFLTMVSLFLTMGVLFIHALGSYFTWQMSALICSFTTFTSLLMAFYTPETPSWLISKGRFQEARDVYFWLRGNGETEGTEFEKMVTAQNLVKKSSVTGQDMSIKMRTMQYVRYIKETCKKPEFYKPIMIMILLYTVYQFSGANVVNAFATDIIEQVVGPEANSSLLMVVLDIERLLCNILAVYLMKIMNRRTLLFSNGFGCVVSNFGIAAYAYLKNSDRLSYDSQWIPITLLAFYMFTLTVGILSVPLSLAGEIFPLEYRGLGNGISMTILYLNFFLSVKMFPVAISSIGLPMTYILYASIVTVSLGVAWFLLPETKDRTLQDIENFFRGYSPDDMKSAKPLRESNEVETMQSTHRIDPI